MPKNTIAVYFRLIAIAAVLATLCNCGGVKEDNSNLPGPNPVNPSESVSVRSESDIPAADINDTDIGMQIRQRYWDDILDECGDYCREGNSGWDKVTIDN